MNVLRNTLLVATLALGAVIGTAACSVSGGVDVGGACVDDRDCASGDLCDPASGLCVTPGPVDSVVVGADCIDDSECDEAAGDYCSDQGICVHDTYAASYGNPGDPCYYDGDCASDYCDIHTDTCN